MEVRGRARVAVVSAIIATCVSVATGCDASEDLDPVVPVEELQADTTINSFLDGLDDEDYGAACNELTPRGFYHLATGETRAFPDDRSVVDCESKLRLLILDSDVDLSGLGNITIEDSRPEGNELVIEDDRGDTWRLTRDGHRITAVPR